jgi:hypothetical protein
MRNRFMAAGLAGLFFISGSVVAASPAPVVAPLRPGLAYQLHATIPADGKSHEVQFVLYDGRGAVVARDTVTVHLAPMYGPLDGAVFTLFHDEKVNAEAQRRGASLAVTLDGTRVEEITFAEFLRGATELVALESSRIPFGGEFARTAKPRAEASKPALSAVIPKLRLKADTETWNGCADDEYCYAQWNYCNENCAPWDPYLPCQACNSNLTECTGGTMTTSWSDDDVTSSTFNGYFCDTFTPGPPYGNHTTEKWTFTIRHREYQTWKCSEEDGDHYTTINTVDTTHTEVCYHEINNYCVGYSVSANGCTF